MAITHLKNKTLYLHNTLRVVQKILNNYTVILKKKIGVDHAK